MDEDKAIRAAKLTLGGMLEKRRAKTAVERAQGQIAPSKYLPNVPRQVHADGGSVDDPQPAAPPPVDLGQVRDQRRMQTFHTGVMNDISTRMTQAMEAHQKALDAGVFDGYEVGDTLRGNPAPFKITGRFVRQWKPTRMTMDHFARFGVQPTLIEHEGKQYVPMLRTQTGVKDSDNWSEGEAYLDMVKDYPKMGGLRSVKADGGSVHLIHGGSDFDEIDPRYSGTGEPGNIRPLGKGLYTYVIDPDDPDTARKAVDWAKRYATKYGRGKKTLHVFKVPKSASTFFNGSREVNVEGYPKPIEGLGAEPQDKLEAYRAHRAKEPATDDPAWWDWSRKGNALYEEAKNAADLRMEHLPMGLTEAAINNPKIAQRVGRFDPETDPDEIIKAIKGYAKGGSVDARTDFLAGNHPDVPEVLYHGNAAKIVQNQKYHGDGKWTSEIDQEATNRNLATQDFRTFKPSAYGNYGQGIYMTDRPDTASQYAMGIRADQNEEKPYGQVMKLHVSMKRPFTDDVLKSPRWKAYLMDTIGSASAYSSEIPHRDALLQKLENGTATVRDLFLHDTPNGTMVNQWNNNDIHAKIRNSGFDGIIAHRPEGGREIVAFKPEQVKSATGNRGTFDPTNPDMTFADGGYVPQKTQKAYKLFRKKGNDLLPLFVNADKPVPMGKWLEAEEGPQGKAQGKVKSKLGDLAYRPGWHAGDLPIATHIGGKSSGDLKKPDYRPDDQVWAEVEMAADKDWQAEADSRGKGVKAHITDQVPLKGFYRYKTNPNMTGNWLIGGHMKVNRVLSDDEVKQINDAAGTADLPRLKRADGGKVPAMFEGMHEDLQDEQGNPLDLWHGTPADKEFEAFDDAKLGSERDHGWYGRGHYLTPDLEQAGEYAGAEDEGTIIGPLHAALKNPYIWDVSDENAAHRTLRDLQSMGIMKEKSKLESWDNLQAHHINRFMGEMQKRGHDGVIMRTQDYSGQRPHRVSEVVVFKPNMIKHKDAEVFDPTDPRIRRADGGRLNLYSKAARIIGSMKDQKMDVKDILKYAEGKGAKRAELAAVDVPPGKGTPKQVADHIEFMQPVIGVKRLGGQNFRFGDDVSYEQAMMDADRRGNHALAEEINREWEQFAGYSGDGEPKYARYQLPGGDNYREHVLTLDSHSHNDPYYARRHWGDIRNPLAHIRMSDRYEMYPSQPLVDLLNKAQASSQARDVPTQLEHGVSEGILSPEVAATIAKRLDLKASKFYGKPDLDKKILHIEEMQSDWNNDARRKGFSTGTEQSDYYKLLDEMRDQAINGIDPTASPEVRRALQAKYNTMDPFMLAMKIGRQEDHRLSYNRAFSPAEAGVPQAPYVNPKRDDWAELAMKHVLHEAAKGGYTGIAFTPDEAQSERWGGTDFNGIYNKKLPAIAQRLVQQHDPDQGPMGAMRLGQYVAPTIDLSPEARDSIQKNSFSSFRRGGYVTHVRRAR